MEKLRKKQLTKWANEQLAQLFAGQQPGVELASVSGDASFRRYFRAQIGERSFIVVDAPPQNENNELFVAVAELFRVAAVAAPDVYAQDFNKGFLLLEDFGDQLYLPRLLELQDENLIASSQSEVDKLYQDAIHTLLKIQLGVDKKKLAPYDKATLRREMRLFEHWFCEGYLGIKLSASDQTLIDHSFTFLERRALTQIQVAVHRDYHSRNLLVLDSTRYPHHAGPGVIDFQDAMAGAYTYDLVSLLRDCYIRWTPEQVEKWSLYYFDLAGKAGLIEAVSTSQFVRDFDLMGLQRNFKVMGIFSRLCIRDNKPQYLADIPLVIQYFREVAGKYQELAPFLDWFEVNLLSVAKSKLNLEL